MKRKFAFSARTFVTLPGLALLFCLHPAFGAEDPPPPLPRPVASFGAASTADGAVFAYGGHAGKAHQYHRDDVHGDLHRWRPGDKEWKLWGKGEPAQGATLLIDGDRILRVGGMAARNLYNEDQDLWSSATVSAFDAKQPGEPTALPDMPDSRSSHDAVIVGGILYVIGGWSMGGEEDGGNRTIWHEHYLTLDLSDPKAEWKKLPQPFQRRALAVGALAGKLYVIGGMGPDHQMSRAVEVLDTVSGKWSRGPDLPAHEVGGFGYAMISHEDRLFASGAYGKLLELVNNEWEEIVELDSPRYFHRLLPAGKGRLLAIGGQKVGGGKPVPEWISISGAGKSEVGMSDWSRFQGPRGDGTTSETGWLKEWPSEGPPEAWRFQLGRGLGAPAVVGNRVFAAGNNGEDQDALWCLNLDKGEVIWKREVKAVTAIHQMPIVPYGPASTPSVVDGRVYHVLRDGQLLCLNAASGETEWTRHLVSDLGGVLPVYGYSSSPWIEEGRLYLDVGQDKPGSNAGSTACLNALTGAVIWQVGEGQAGYATPAVRMIQGRKYLVLFKGEALELRDAADGSLLARHATTTRDFCNCATPVLEGDVLFISHTGGDGSTGLRWDGRELKPVWNDPKLGLLFQSGLPWKTGLLVFNDQNRGVNELRFLDTKTGETKWTSDEVEKGNGVLCDDGHALYLSGKGELMLVEMGEGGVEILHRHQALGGKSYVQPVLANHRILCRNNEGELVAFDLRVGQ